jgi:hypothetical protein
LINKHKNEFQWDGNGTELSSLKNECHDCVEGLIDKQTFNELLLMKENGNVHFDSVILTGCKQYALSRQISVDGNIIPVEICN